MFLIALIPSVLATDQIEYTGFNFSSGIVDPKDITSNGTHFFVIMDLGEGDLNVRTFNSSGDQIDSFGVNANGQGIAYNDVNNTLAVTDSDVFGHIVEYFLDGTVTGFNITANNPTQITWDGNFYYFVNSNNIRKYDGDGNNIINFTISQANGGIDWIDTLGVFFITDFSSSSNVSVYDTDFNLLRNFSITEPPTDFIEGITNIGNKVYFAMRSPAAVYEYEILEDIIPPPELPLEGGGGGGRAAAVASAVAASAAAAGRASEARAAEAPGIAGLTSNERVILIIFGSIIFWNWNKIPRGRRR